MLVHKTRVFRRKVAKSLSKISHVQKHQLFVSSSNSYSSSSYLYHSHYRDFCGFYWVTVRPTGCVSSSPCPIYIHHQSPCSCSHRHLKTLCPPSCGPALWGSWRGVLLGQTETGRVRPVGGRGSVKTTGSSLGPDLHHLLLQRLLLLCCPHSLDPQREPRGRWYRTSS